MGYAGAPAPVGAGGFMGVTPLMVQNCTLSPPNQKPPYENDFVLKYDIQLEHTA
jgi:hypothetical protein